MLSENKNYGSEERAPLMRSFISDICLMGIGKLGMSWYNFNSTLYNWYATIIVYLYMILWHTMYYKNEEAQVFGLKLKELWTAIYVHNHQTLRKKVNI